MQQKEFYEKNLGITLVPVGLRKANMGRRATRGAMLLDDMMVAAKKTSSSYQSAPASISTNNANAEPSFDEVIYEAGIYVDFKIERAGQ